jgi:hypothetical protein
MNKPSSLLSMPMVGQRTPAQDSNHPINAFSHKSNAKKSFEVVFVNMVNDEAPARAFHALAGRKFTMKVNMVNLRELTSEGVICFVVRHSKYYTPKTSSPKFTSSLIYSLQLFNQVVIGLFMAILRGSPGKRSYEGGSKQGFAVNFTTYVNYIVLPGFFCHAGNHGKMGMPGGLGINVHLCSPMFTLY